MRLKQRAWDVGEEHLGMYHIYFYTFLVILIWFNEESNKVVHCIIVNNWSSYYMFSIWNHIKSVYSSYCVCECDHSKEVHHGGDTTLATELISGGEASLWWLFRYRLSQALFWFMWNPLDSNFSLRIWQHSFANLINIS